MKTLFTVLPYVLILVGGFCFGWSGRGIYMKNRFPSIPVSQTSIMEINLACGGNFRDLAINRKYVYANCVNPPKPVTVQNYLFK